jgi:hypothetical protein
MKKATTILIFSILTLASNLLSAQTIQTTQICHLASEVSETSGLVWIDGELWTHNDSGCLPELYQLDTITGEVLRTVIIQNASNTDWEDISIDDEYIYIGDFGNNNGDRTDLKIYRISRDFIYQESDEVTADTISFYYPNQTQFEWDSYTTNYDCEAMIATSDSLYLFSKNWGNYKTYLYALPKIPGNHAAHLKDSLDLNGLVTGAVYNKNAHKVLLIGYAPYLSGSFVHLLDNFTDDNFFSGSELQINISLIFHQVEGIEWLRETEFIFSFESFNTVNAGLNRGNLSDLSDILDEIAKKAEPDIFPNPAAKNISINNCELYNELRIYDINGQLIKEQGIDSSTMLISIQSFRAGTYSLEFSSPHRVYRSLIVVSK